MRLALPGLSVSSYRDIETGIFLDKAVTVQQS